MQVKNINNILFPDIIKTMIDLKIYNSMSDFVEKIRRGTSERSRSGHQLFRDMRNKCPDKSEQKKLIKDMSQLFPNPVFKPKISDIKAIGSWFLLKSMYEEYKSNKSMQHMWPLADYVIHFCEMEKNYITSIKKRLLPEVRLIDYWEDFFFLDSKLCESAKTSLQLELDSSTGKGFDIWEKENKKLLASVFIHQYLHAAAIFEQDTYCFNRKSCTPEQFEKQEMISRLLPTINSDGKYSGAPEKLLSYFVKSSGFSSKNEFFNSLCRKDVDEVDTVEKQYKRIKLKLTPDSLNTLLFREKHPNNIEQVPAGLVIACRICDEIKKNLIEKGFRLEWIVKEFSMYGKYQKQIKENINSLK